MKEPIVLTVDEVVTGVNPIDAILDARSPSEHAIDRLPGAINTPVLDDQERAAVGTLYKQASGFEAKRVGAAMVARNIARLLDGPLGQQGRDWRPLVYCWRGGNRSGSLATVLTRVGWVCYVLAGGYKAFRARVIEDLATLPLQFQFVVLAGRTGSGKSQLLTELRQRGEQVLDLETLAEHRGSVLGAFENKPQPSQRQFESRLWDVLRRLDASRPVWVESESRRIGTCHQPDALISAIRQSHCVVIEATRALRADLLLAQYQHFVANPESLHQRLDRLRALHGSDQLAAWREAIEAARWPEFVESLLERHYDPAYDRSMRTNFVRLAQAPSVSLTAADPAALSRTASALIDLRKSMAAS